MNHRRTLSLLSLTAVGALGLSACGGSGFNDSSSAKSDGQVSVLIGSSGDAETKAVTDAVAAWSKSSGVKAKVTVASDLNQELSQGFASNNPPDVFYVSTDNLAGYAANGSLYAYGDQLSNKDQFFPNLVDAFTVGNKFYCAPKDFSTLGLVINTKLWKRAGLHRRRHPHHLGPARGGGQEAHERQGRRTDVQPGVRPRRRLLPRGRWRNDNDDGTQATVDSPANAQALGYVQKLLKEGVAKYSSDLGAGWGGEAFGKQQAP